VRWIEDCRQQKRPVLQGGAAIMDRIFKAAEDSRPPRGFPGARSLVPNNTNCAPFIIGPVIDLG
jgi:hypothetical protein